VHAAPLLGCPVQGSKHTPPSHTWACSCRQLLSASAPSWRSPMAALMPPPASRPAMPSVTAPLHSEQHRGLDHALPRAPVPASKISQASADCCCCHPVLQRHPAVRATRRDTGHLAIPQAVSPCYHDPAIRAASWHYTSHVRYGPRPATCLGACSPCFSAQAAPQPSSAAVSL